MKFKDIIKEWYIELIGFPFLIGLFIFTGRELPLIVAGIWGVAFIIFQSISELELRIIKLERKKK